MESNLKKGFWSNLIVHDKNDPRALVPKRFGIGYTINFGSAKGRILFFVFVIATVTLLILHQYKII
jgi:uncharacterized membrane protein